MSVPASSQHPGHAPAAVQASSGRRSFTLPARAAKRTSSVPAPTASADGIETLFVCSDSKIFSFTTHGPTRPLSPARARDTPRPIPWKTPTERTLAVGVLRVYRVTASNVSFLNSGNLLHTIFPRSQCWCVDNQSVFVLRIRQDSYYRIELPFDTEEDKEKIALFKSVLSQVMQYERTQCPFRRGAGTEELDRPKSPPRRTIKRKPSGQAKKWVLDKTWVPEQHGHRPSTSGTERSDASTTCSNDDDDNDDDDRRSICTESSEAVSEAPETPFARTLPQPLPTSALPKAPPRRLSVAERASLFQGVRSVTAPIRRQRTGSVSAMQRIVESPAAKPGSDVEKPILERQVSDAISLASSADSFYSLETATPRSPSPKFLDTDAVVMNPWASTFSKQQEEPRGRATHRRQISEVTVRASSIERTDPSAPVTPTAPYYSTTIPSIDIRPSSAPSTPPLVSDSDDDSLGRASLDLPTPPDAIRMRRLTGASQRRAFSPMPPAQNLFCPPKHNPSKDFTNALVRKTCEIVLGPPAHLVSMMLRIATTISNGIGFSAYRARRAEKIPCSWESDDEADWAEDDFGIPLNNMRDSALRRRTFSGEVD
ncbi:peroxisome inheritance [Stemphylium lycopersici]|uniref:Inheritance of peroxisomes protein 1 n=1 Tax=Stemphylium lycopersici TaxID=183478 RepID=A0A364N8M6_STELY|nr:peroxisome inheritance [Stemphylium lycopersici]RAR13649.1 peroxisome inheritance [Stemphylium lycopersici]